MNLHPSVPHSGPRFDLPVARPVAVLVAMLILGCNGEPTTPNDVAAVADPGPLPADQQPTDRPDGGDVLWPDGFGDNTVLPDLPAADVAAADSDVAAEIAAAVDADGLVPETDAPSAATRLRYDFATRPLGLPFPYGYYAQLDPQSPTGLRVQSDDDRFSNDLVDGMLKSMASYRQALQTLNGFGPYAWLSVAIDGAAPLGWRLEPQDSLAPSAPVRLYVAAFDGTLERWPVAAEVGRYEDRAKQPHDFLDVLPSRPLPDGSRAVLAVTTDFADAAGAAVVADTHFLMVAGLKPLPSDPELASVLQAEAERLAPTLAALDAAGLPADRLAIAFDVPIARARADLLAFSQYLATNPDFATAAYTFDPDNDGADNVWQPGEPGFPGFEPSAAVALFARGTFERKDLRHPDVLNGTFVIGADGLPQVHHREPVDFWLALPSDPPAGPWPVVLIVHGIDDSSAGMLPLAGPLAERGIASLAFDLPAHGADGNGGSSFLRIDQPLVLRDNFRQAAVDVLTALHLLQQLADDGLDLAPFGGDGQADLAADRLGLIGHSLGTMVSLSAAGLGHEPDAAVFAVGGGGLVHFFGGYLSTYGLDRILPGTVVHGAQLAAGHVVAAGDPLLYAAMIRAETPAPQNLRPILMLQAENDTVMPHGCVTAAAAALQLPLIAPVVMPVAGLPVVSADQTDSGLVQLAGATHDILFGGDNPADQIRAARQHVAHYLATWFATGTPEIAHPFADPPAPARR